MLDLKLIVDDKERIKKELQKRQADVSGINPLYKKANIRTKLMIELENEQAELNKISKNMGFLKEGTSEFKKSKKTSKKIKKKILKLDRKFIKVKEEIKELILNLPNLPHPDAPIGKNENENVIGEEKWIGLGKVDQSESHDVICKNLDMIDMERAAKISGSRFAIYKNEGAQYLRALQSFCLTENIKKGYQELNLPVIVNTNTMYGTGQLPKFSDDLFRIHAKEQWLIPTAEVTLTNYYSDEVIDLSKPKKLTAYSLCFRSEAGSGGKDTRGVIRLHQFHKVELVKITSQNDKESEYKAMLEDVESLLVKLEIPYRKVILCTGDLGFSAEYTTDFEVWFPSQGKFREVSSVSMFGDFQGRRAKIRYKENGKSIFASTINGSGLALDRIFAALVENRYNKETKKIDWPEALSTLARKI